MGIYPGGNHKHHNTDTLSSCQIRCYSIANWVPSWKPLARCVKLRTSHAPGMPGTVSPPSLVCDPDMHHGTCVTHVPWCMPRSLTRGILWSRWREKRSRHSRCMCNPQLYVPGKRPMGCSEMRQHWTGVIMTAIQQVHFNIKHTLLVRVQFNASSNIS